MFLRTGTYTATAERLALHKNSVQYRIRKAEEALDGRLRIDDRRADLELALPILPATSARRYFGPWTPDRDGRTKHSIVRAHDRIRVLLNRGLHEAKKAHRRRLCFHVCRR